MNAASSSTEQTEATKTLPKKKKKKKAAPPPPPPPHKKKALVLPAVKVPTPNSRSSSSEVGAIIHAAARGNTKSDAISKSVLPKV